MQEKEWSHTFLVPEGARRAPLAALVIAGVLGALVFAPWSPTSPAIVAAVAWRIVWYVAAALLAAVDARACGLGGAVKGLEVTLLGALGARAGALGRAVKYVVLSLAPHSLELEVCLKRAGKKAGVRDSRALLPKGTVTAVEQVLRCFRNEAGLTQMGSVIAHAMITDGLSAVLRMIKDRETEGGKAILRGKIERPVFIAGPHRSGTTYLHQLLAQHRGFICPRHFEMNMHPVRPQGLSQAEHDDVRIKASEGMLSMMDQLMPEAKFHHEYGVLDVEEDSTPGIAFQCSGPGGIIGAGGSSYSYPVFFEVPSFTRWLGSEAASAGHKAACSLHRNFLQHLQYHAEQRELEGVPARLRGGGGGGGYRGGCSGSSGPAETALRLTATAAGAPDVARVTGARAEAATERGRRWVNKNGLHMLTLEHLFAEYSDAMVVQTHRRPRDVIISWFHFVLIQQEGWLGRPLTEAERHRKIGRDHLAFMREMMDAAMRFRRANPALARQFVDVRFEDLVSRPVESARMVCMRLGASTGTAAGEDPDSQSLGTPDGEGNGGGGDSGLDGRLQACRDAQELRVKDNLARRSYSWKLEDFGVTEAQVAEAFAPYEEWAKGLAMVDPSDWRDGACSCSDSKMALGQGGDHCRIAS